MNNDYRFELINPYDKYLAPYLNSEEDCTHPQVEFKERWYKNDKGRAVREYSMKTCTDCSKCFDNATTEEFDDFPFVLYKSK